MSYVYIKSNILEKYVWTVSEAKIVATPADVNINVNLKKADGVSKGVDTYCLVSIDG